MQNALSCTIVDKARPLKADLDIYLSRNQNRCAWVAESLKAVHERWLKAQALHAGATKSRRMRPRALLGLILALLHAGSALRPGGAGPWRLGRTVARAAVDEDEAFEMAARAARRAARPLSADDDDDDWALDPPEHAPRGAEQRVARRPRPALRRRPRDDGRERRFAPQARRIRGCACGSWARRRARRGRRHRCSAARSRRSSCAPTSPGQRWSARTAGASGRGARWRRRASSACRRGRWPEFAASPSACLNKRRYRDAQRYEGTGRRVVAVAAADPRRP